MMELVSPVIGTDAPTVTMLPAPTKTKPQPHAVPETVLPMQLPTTESHLGASYINDQSQQVTHNNSNISVCSSNSDAQENLKSLFIKRVNDQIYTYL